MCLWENRQYILVDSTSLHWWAAKILSCWLHCTEIHCTTTHCNDQHFTIHHFTIPHCTALLCDPLQIYALPRYELSCTAPTSMYTSLSKVSSKSSSHWGNIICAPWCWPPSIIFKTIVWHTGFGHPGKFINTNTSTTPKKVKSVNTKTARLRRAAIHLMNI